MKQLIFLTTALFVNINIYCQTDPQNKVDTVSVYPNYKPTWTYVITSSDKEEWYVYKEVNYKTSHYVTVWIKIKSPNYTFEKRVYKNAEIKQLISFDCLSKKYSSLQSVVYNSKGSTVYSEEIETDWTNVIPESVMEAVLNKVCKMYND